MTPPLRTACALALLAVTAASPQPSGADGDDEPGSDVDEVVVFGVRTGEIEGDPTAFGDVLDVDAYTAESKDLPDLLSEQAGVFVRRFDEVRC